MLRPFIKIVDEKTGVGQEPESSIQFNLAWSCSRQGAKMAEFPQKVCLTYPKFG